MKSKIDAYFGINKSKTTLITEIFAGLASFLATAYILTVNPNNILTSGASDPRWASVFIATALGASIGSLLMALFAKMPLVQAPGMGVNALVGAIIGGSTGFAYSLGNTLFLIFISGIIFLIFSYIRIGKDKIPLREKIFDGIPIVIRDSIPVGIGLFIAFIGFKNAGIIVGNKFTLLELIDFSNPELWNSGGLACSALVAIFGLIVTTILAHFKVKGAVIIGIFSATLLSIPLGVADINILLGKTPGVAWNIFENFSTFFKPSEGGTFLALFTEGLNFPISSLFTSIMLVVSFVMVDMFDTMGTIVGCTANASLTDEDGKPHNYGKIIKADSLASCIGALLGTTTVTVLVESGAGVAEGGRTGFTALTASILFLASIFLLPLFAFIPISAAASALIYVGALMMKNIKKVDFKNIRNSIPAFLTIILMPLTYSITDGIGIGLISYFIINVIIYLIERIKGKRINLNISAVTFITAVLFLIYFLMPSIG